MKNIEVKNIPLELKDFDKGKREAVIAHAAYDNIDRTKDISRKGMFTKSWSESKADIFFYKNHNPELAPGKVLDVFETESKAYTKVFLGTHTLGEDTLKMMDEGIITKASFGYIPIKKNFIEKNGQKIRELTEVKHIETSVLTMLQANPLASVESVTKAFNNLMLEVKTLSQSENAALKRIMASDFNSLNELFQIAQSIDEKSDLYTWVMWQISRRSDAVSDLRGQLKWNSGELKQFQDDIKMMEKFCANTTATDACIEQVQNDIQEAKHILSLYDTAYTVAAKALQPDASESKNVELINNFIKTLNKG